MRLLSGILAGQQFGSVLTGDDSLQQRPMERIADPLKAMGARIKLVEGHAPIRIRATREGLDGI
jgi:3-phosphoshikimate 1-carboxyvinyltransferase